MIYTNIEEIFFKIKKISPEHIIYTIKDYHVNGRRYVKFWSPSVDWIGEVNLLNNHDIKIFDIIQNYLNLTKEEKIIKNLLE